MKRGFTLIELLVVIAIIAILAAILFPVFARAREKARQSSCLSNVKQLTLSILMYAQDYDECFPGRFAITEYPDYAYPEKRWDRVVMPYVANEQILICPSTRKTPVSYGYNVTGRIGPPVGLGASLADVENPASVILICDTDRAPTAYPPASYDWATWSSYYPGVHNEGVNAGHVDGHAKWYRPDVLYSNRSNVPFFDDP